ncbi:MAG: YraN family protein [Patescibacteria group bacterium]|nr:YraN family protein [Patescibacteria group bacterium]
MSKTKKRKIGDLGEEITCKFLKNKDYKVLERNYWKPWGEIDIVAEKANLLRFIEVKTVSREISNGISREPTQVRPEENFHPVKLKRLHRAIQTYLLDHKISENKLWQIDLACVYLDFSTKKARVELMENIIL